MTTSETCLLDTNILVYATTPSPTCKGDLLNK
jgi:hypothetical protein